MAFRPVKGNDVVAPVGYSSLIQLGNLLSVCVFSVLGLGLLTDIHGPALYHHINYYFIHRRQISAACLSSKPFRLRLEFLELRIERRAKKESGESKRI
jgi:hypothetical protein